MAGLSELSENTGRLGLVAIVLHPDWRGIIHKYD
jgi:hypothetical protein